MVVAWDWGRQGDREPLFGAWAVLVWHDKRLVEIVVKVAQPCECTSCHRIIYLRW